MISPNNWVHTVKKKQGTDVSLLSYFQDNAIDSCSCNPFCRLVIHFVDKSRANYVWEVVPEQKWPIPNYSLQFTTPKIVYFIQISTQKTKQQTLLMSCNTYNEKGTASITKGISSLRQIHWHSTQNHRNVSEVTRTDQKSNIQKIMCNSGSVLRLVNAQIWKNLYAPYFTTNYNPQFHLQEGGRKRRMSIWQEVCKSYGTDLGCTFPDCQCHFSGKL